MALVLYLHGFASSPQSRKARAFAAHAEAQGHTVLRLDCRQPSMTELSLDAIVRNAQRALDDASEPAFVVGSSLGGLAAVHLEQRDPRILGLLLLAPAFGLVARWRERLGPSAWDAFAEQGSLEVEDHATGGTTSVHYAFIEELERMEAMRDAGADPRVAVSIVHGRRDDVVPIEGSLRFAQAANARMISVDDDHELGSSLPHIFSAWDGLWGALRQSAYSTR